MRRMMKFRSGVRRYALGPHIAATVLVWLPFLVLASSFLVAGMAGCEVSAAGPSICLVAGRDIGGSLYAAQFTGWLAVALSPLMLATVAIWLMLSLLALIRLA